MMTHYISSEILDLDTIQQILPETSDLALSEEARINISKSFEYLKKKMEQDETPISGINTGFGSLYNRKIPSDKLSQLQEILVMSHACGTGSLVPKDIGTAHV